MQKDSRVQSESTGLSVSSDGSTGRIQVLISVHSVYICACVISLTAVVYFCSSKDEFKQSAKE